VTYAQNEIQNAPYEVKAVAPKTLPLRNSHIPARSCATPPYAMATPSTIGKVSVGMRPAFTRLNKKVVSAKAPRPSGAGSAIILTCADASSREIAT
jgi:hypothetical protein